MTQRSRARAQKEDLDEAIEDHLRGMMDEVTRLRFRVMQENRVIIYVLLGYITDNTYTNRLQSRHFSVASKEEAIRKSAL